MLSPTPRFLVGLGGQELQEVLSACKVRNYRAREIVLHEGEPATSLFLLRSGNAKFYRLTLAGRKVLLTRLIGGDVFGLGTLLAGPVPYIATAETLSESEMLVWEQARIRKLAEKYPGLAKNALEIILRYLAAHTDRLVDLVTCTAEQRLARALLRLGKRVGKISPTGIEIYTTNEELSDLANVSAFTVSRILNRWIRAGALTRARRKVFIRTPEKLLTD
jgi:CRP/FNR family transcriptional regulator